MLSLALATFVACGGGDDGDGDGGNGGGRGGTGGGGGGAGLPTRLPDDAGECASATGSDGCFFEACCDELVTCSENPACATVFDCYVTCGEDSDCFANCALDSLEDGANDFAYALACVAPAAPDCGSGGTGGTGGSGGGSNVGPLGTATDDLGWNLVVSEDPFVAEYELEEDGAVSEVITADGGSLMATAADGTSFELTFPEGAVYEPVTITLTPLASLVVPGLDADAAFGVRVEPEGLPLLFTPTLEITPPDGETYGPDEFLPIALSGAEDFVSVALAEPQRDTLRLELTHFSGYGGIIIRTSRGVGSTLGDAQVRARFGGDVDDRMQSALGAHLIEASKNPTEGNIQGLDRLIQEFEKHVIEPRMMAAGESCAIGQHAIQSTIGIERFTALIGLSGLLKHTFTELLGTVGEACIREEYALCHDSHIITRVMPVFLGFMRQAQLLGLYTELDGMAFPPSWVLEMEDVVRKCLKFELQFDSSVLYSETTPDLSMDETVTARIPISLKATLALLPPEAFPGELGTLGALISGDGVNLLESTDYSVQTQEACKTIDEEIPQAGEFLVSFLTFTPADPAANESFSERITDVGISIALGQNLSSYVFTQKRVEETGCGEVEANGEEVLSWSTTLGAELLSSTATDENGAWIRDWMPASGDIIATKDVSIRASDGGLSTRGTAYFVLFHTPE